MDVVRKVGRINSETLKGKIYSELRRALMAGRFAPGEVLTIKMLADQLETGLMPVRESVQRLVSEGALLSFPNRTIRVPFVSRAEFDELCDIRVANEALAAARAAQMMQAEEVAETTKAMRRLDDAVKRGEAEVMLEANIAFHFGIYRAARYNHLLSLIESLWLRNGPLLIHPFQVSTPHRKGFLRGHVHHQQLLKALSAHDAEAASEAVVKLIRSAQAWYHENYQFDGTAAKSASASRR
jgi:DNA-binding GntR family transcriptional regulator